MEGRAFRVGRGRASHDSRRMDRAPDTHCSGADSRRRLFLPSGCWAPSSRREHCCSRSFASDGWSTPRTTWRTTPGSSAAATLGARLGLRRRARLLVSPRVGTPMAGGLWRPTVFLPAAARTWSAESVTSCWRMRFADLAGGDPLRHVVARRAVAAYWFHPLAWMAARQAAISREQACDEAVLAIGTRPSVYARGPARHRGIDAATGPGSRCAAHG